MITDSAPDLLGPARLTDVALTTLVRESLGDPAAELGPWRVEPVDYVSGTPSTGALLRVLGSTAAGAPWSLFCKVLQSARHWPLINLIPEEVRGEFMSDFPWRAELDSYACGLPLPAGLRLPRIHLADDLGEDRLALWMEDVRTDPEPWDLARFARAAHLLGRLAALRAEERLPEVPPRGLSMRYYLRGRVLLGALPAIADPGPWEHPLLAGHRHLRADLLRLGDLLPALLDGVDALPHTRAHGDASPQNLLVPVDRSAEFVAIDWGFNDLLPVGFDLGQLLIGLAHAGELSAADLPAVDAAIGPAYLAGLAAEGMHVDPAVVRHGYLATLVVRSTLTALPFELLGAPVDDGLAALFGQRLALTRYLVELATEITQR
jgi:hypothetical protein